jgi:hypothetical protein
MGLYDEGIVVVAFETGKRVVGDAKVNAEDGDDTISGSDTCPIDATVVGKLVGRGPAVMGAKEGDLGNKNEFSKVESILLVLVVVK